MDVDKNLNKILDIEPVEKTLSPDEWSNLGPPPPPPDPDKQVVKFQRPMLKAPEQEVQEIKDDFSHGRDTYRELIDKGNSALDDLLDVAKASQEPRAYEVVAALIKTTADTTKELLDLHKKHKHLMDDPRKPPEPQDYGTSINVEKAVFVGSTKELLNKIKEERDNKSSNS